MTTAAKTGNVALKVSQFTALAILLDMITSLDLKVDFDIALYTTKPKMDIHTLVYVSSGSRELIVEADSVNDAMGKFMNWVGTGGYQQYLETQEYATADSNSPDDQVADATGTP